MDRISRRKLLKYLSASIGTLAAAKLISSCTPKDQTPLSNPTVGLPSTVKPGSTATQQNTNTTAPTDTSNPHPTATTSPLPDLVVAHGTGPMAMAQRAMAALGGMERFVPKDGWVIVKPNICNAYHGYEYASTTNPWLVGAVVKMCFAAGAKKVQVMDSPFGGTAANAYVTSGIAEQVGQAGGEMVDMPNFMFSPVKVKDAPDRKPFMIYEDVFKADLVINLPIAKTHGLAKLTLGMKNLMGLILDRQSVHLSMPKRLTDLNRTIRPGLIIMDAIRILTANGPTGGNLADVKQLDTILATTDVVAADSYAAGFFGLKATDLDYVVEAVNEGLGNADLNSLKIEELTVGA